jgi:hypothetical protein
MKKESLMDAILKGEKPMNFIKQNMTTAFDTFVSPIDGTVISSKREVREHEKKHNVIQVGNDLKGKGATLNKTREQSKLKQQGKLND